MWGFEIFQSSPVCELCGVARGNFEDFHSSLLCGAFKFFKVLLCVGSVLWCVGTLKFFNVPLCVRLCPCTGEIEFSQKSL